MLRLLLFFITVAIPSLTAPVLARILGVSLPDPRGFLIVGANTLAIQVGLALQQQGLSVVLADISWRNVQKARLEGLNSYYGNSASEHADWRMDMVGIGRMLGLSNHEQINTLSAVKYYNEFGSNTIFLLPSQRGRQNIRLSNLNERYSKRLFTHNYSYEFLDELVSDGGSIKTTKITTEFSWDKYLTIYQNIAIPLFAISPKKLIHVISPDSIVNIMAGWSVISLVSESNVNR
jgi:hypothetical protein